ncbi:MAG: DUF1573 domain-containing protein [Planctomycetaceae bacterium]|jgi:hypothetical protein|nr:DUF1573 domain-containing protein [Planctomycetaceae bacterium]
MRNSKKDLFSCCCLGVLIIFSFSLSAEETVTQQEVPKEQNMVESTPDGKWIINSTDSRKIYAIQCGLDVTLFALKYFKIEYSLPRVSVGLPLTEKGISLADIQQILLAYGLKTDARKNVTLKKIASLLNGEYIALFPLSSGNGLNHYYIGMRDDQGVVQLVNVSKGISPLVSQKSKEYNERLEKKFQDAGGVVLFIKKEKNKNVSSLASVKINSQTIELGEFMIGGPDSSTLIEASFRLINTSDSPIIISSIQTSCGCTQLKWEGGILKAGENKEVQFSVIPGAWGRGEQKKIARVSFADGSSTDVAIHGTGQTPVESQRIELSQYSAVVEITEETDKESFDVRLAKLSSYVRPIQEIKMTSDVSWLAPELTEQAKQDEYETAELHAKISVKELRPLLESNDGKIQGTLHISGVKDMEPVEMKVEVFQRDFYRFSQYLVSLAKDSSETITIQVEPENENDKIKILEIKPEADFIIAENQEENGVNTISIRLDKEKEIKTGYYTITAKLENSKGTQNAAQITVNATSP